MKIFLLFTLIVVVAAQPPPTDPKPPHRRVVAPPRPQPTDPPAEKELPPDPCEKMTCKGEGEECRRNPNRPDVANCVCIESCQDREFTDPVCTNTNAQFNTICDFRKARCQCKKGGKCSKQPGDYIVYYGQCGEIACNEAFGMQDYPRRLAQWLRDTHTMRTMLPADSPVSRDEVMNPLTQAELSKSASMYNSPNGNAVYVSWWFCDLDQSKSSKLSKKDISVLTRALMPGDQCIQRFLSKCDKNSDAVIDFSEWHGSGCFNVTSSRTSC